MEASAADIEKTRIAGQFIRALPHSRDLGMELVGIGEGWAEMALDYDPRFVGDLRNGRTPRPETEKRVEHFMNSYRGTVHAD